MKFIIVKIKKNNNYYYVWNNTKKKTNNRLVNRYGIERGNNIRRPKGRTVKIKVSDRSAAFYPVT